MPRFDLDVLSEPHVCINGIIIEDDTDAVAVHTDDLRPNELSMTISNESHLHMIAWTDLCLLGE
jgi:hypothetical protein